MMQKAKRREFTETHAEILSGFLPGYTVTVIADNGKDRIEVIRGPSEGFGAGLMKRLAPKQN